MAPAPQTFQSAPQQQPQAYVQPAPVEQQPVYVQPAYVQPVGYPVYYPRPYYAAPYYPPIGLSLNFGYSRGYGHHHWR